MKQKLLAELLDRTRLRRWVSACLSSRGMIGLNYHRVGDSASSPLDRGLWSATAEAFDEQMAWLKLNADVISPSDIDAARRDQNGRHVLITFDDGYRDNYEQAFPILRRHGLPATFFIATGFIDQPRLPWWDEIAFRVRTAAQAPLTLPEWYDAPLSTDEEHAEATIHTLLSTYKSLPLESAVKFLEQLRSRESQASDLGRELWMTWDMIREMSSQGMTIGGHTVSHLILSSASAEEQRNEISTCARRIHEEIGKPIEYFAYPVGSRHSFNLDTRSALREIGVRYAFSYYGGFASTDSEFDSYDVPRMAIEPYIDRSWFRAIVEVPRWFCRAQAVSPSSTPSTNEIGA
jgi:peptidoglycan/xylan/chitin deacetylase (PgdA/CDA1 family)